ncbi:Glycosyl transferase family 2 [Marinobacter daqiaonensis]|uniref:Glycosyl transferase family 2 n=1 Tax=Marinobacter daqiaonensis TaxID=650891 RepID=A0A1I6IB63_9GAMM|nr:glycosyltransferase family A protein [Marinobacter daqiaonensis]SFR63911.1 Glycosyl transferase family 2 [Marinobacter daqiaonensis]
MQYPGRVSVVIPVYNGEQYVAQAIDSVLDQTYGDVELLVVNDGSTDRTMQVLSRYGDRIKVVSINNQGLSVARNVGILEASGEFIALLDDDDVWHPEKLSIQTSLMKQNPDWVVVCNERVKFQEEEEIRFEAIRCPVSHRSLSNYDILHRNPVHCSSALVRKSVWSRARLFVPHLGGAAEDTEMWARLTRYGKVMLCSPHLTHMRDHPANTTKTHAYRKRRLDSLEFMRETWSDDERAMKIVATNLRGSSVAFAYEAADRGEFSLASRHFFRAYCLNPKSIKWLVKSLACRLPVRFFQGTFSRMDPS